MPITINLDAMLVKRKISLTELSKAVGLSLTNLSMLKNGNVRGVRFETFGKDAVLFWTASLEIYLNISPIQMKKMIRIEKTYSKK